MPSAQARLRERTVGCFVGWLAGLVVLVLRGLWHEPAGRWIGAPCSRFPGAPDYQGPRLLSANLQIKLGRGEVEGKGDTWGWGQGAHGPMNPAGPAVGCGP